MFNDLTNETLTPIYTQNVKAYPSINSPNSGGFNDEINAKWVSKKFSSKSFIVNPETDFIRVYQTADTLVTTSGSVCVDGYMLKLAAAGKTSFDSDDSGNISVNTQYIQRFTDGLLGTGTDYPVKSNLSDILFSEYNPDSVEDSDYTTVNANWANATENNLCVGYVQITYYGTYMEQLTVSASSVTYNGKTIPLRSYNLTYDSRPDDIKNVIGSDFGKAFALNSMISSLGSSVSIFYPISSNLSFVDIFGLKISLGWRGIQTKLYPYTMSPLMDMNANEPLSSISFADCDLTTFPQNLYDFETLYDENKDRYTFANNASLSFTVSDFPESSFFNTEDPEEPEVPNGIFKYIQLQSLLNDYVPENQQNIRNIKNNLSYFVLNLDNTEYASYQIPIVNKSGVSTLIPVAFMTSAGNICPNGIISEETSTAYPVEGYLHFVKRVYLNIHGRQETETNINNVTVSQLCSDPEQNATWISWFNGFYSTILAKAICAYLHIAYCSIMDNIARYNMQNIADSLKIKAIGCGNALQSSGSVSQSDFYVTQSYSHTGYTYDSATDSFNTSTFTDDIVYRKDITSDNYKINGCIGKSITDVSNMPISYLQAINMTDLKNVAVAFGDPIEYIQNCVSIGSNSTVSMPVYKISSTGEIVNVYTNNQQSTLTVSNVYVDNNLMPLRNNYTVGQLDCYIPMATHQVEMPSGSITRQSIINGLCVNISRYTWVVYIPCLLKLHKDGQNYLAGKNFLDNTYSGCSITYDLSDATDDNSAFLYYMCVPQISSGVAPDYESKFIYLDTTSDSAKVNRNAFISVDRVYDPDGPSSLEAYIQNMLSGTESTIQQMQQTINSLQTFINRYATIMYYHHRVHIGEFGGGGVSIYTPIMQWIQSNSRLALKIDLYETANVTNKLDCYSLIAYQVTDTGAGVPTNDHNYNENVKVDYYYSVNGDPSSSFGTVLITNTSNDSIDNILFDFQIYRDKYSTLLPTDVSCDITALAAIALDDNDLHKTLSVGDTDVITVDSTIPANQTVTWSSDNTDVVTVDQSGNITAVAAGTAKVTASLEVENATVFVSSVVTVQ